MSIKESDVNVDAAALEEEMNKSAPTANNPHDDDRSMFESGGALNSIKHYGVKDGAAIAALEKARERMASRRNKVKAGISRVALAINLTLAVVTLGLVGFSYHSFSDDKFYSSKAVDERACRIKVGNDWYLLGRRYYTYNFTELFGIRLVDTAGIEERTELFVDASEMIITGTTKEGGFWSVHHPLAEPGVVPLDDAERYTVFSGKVVGSVTYADFCKQFTKSHPFATE